MILRPQGNFLGNGVLRGTVTAYDDRGEPLGWEQYGNWSAPNFREQAAKNLAANTGISIEKAQAMLAQMLKVARKEADTSPEPADHPVKSQMKAGFPGLIDIVKQDDGRLAFLIKENGSLITRLEWNNDGSCYIPPAQEHLPYLVPREAEVRRAFREDNDSALFESLLNWHKRASKLGDESHYELVVLYDFHTYLADKSDYSPYLVFQTIDSERGKTRQGSSIAWVAYRGIVTETLQEANLFRWADSLGCTLFFDVKNVWQKAEKRGSEDILLGRFQLHGPKVARTLDPQAGPFQGVVYFSVYGPTILAVNEPLRDPLLSRSIVIVPPEATGKYPNIYPAEALPLKERLVAFRARQLDKPLPTVSKPVDGRLGDILQPIGQIASLIGGKVMESFPGLARSLAQERLSERSESQEARLLTAVQSVAQGVNDDKLPVNEIAAVYNDGVPEKRQLSEESVGRRLSSLGFKTCRLGGGGRARFCDQELLSALLKKYGVTFSENGGLQEPSLLSQPSQLASAQACDGSVTVSPTVVTDVENRHTTVTKHNYSNQLQNDPPVTVVTVVTDLFTPSKNKNVKPDKPCYSCGYSNYWQRPDGGWVCGTCHPNPGGSNG